MTGYPLSVTLGLSNNTYMLPKPPQQVNHKYATVPVFALILAAFLLPEAYHKLGVLWEGVLITFFLAIICVTAVLAALSFLKRS